MTAQPDVIVGCPARGRAWILGQWADHALAACDNAGLRAHVVVLMPRWDRGAAWTLSKGSADATVLWTDEPEVRMESRGAQWGAAGEFEHMVELRNRLLGFVREIGPALYWSLDSDILAAPDCLALAVPLLTKYDAVGMKCYMEAYGTAAPNYFIRGRRYEAFAEAEVDVIMASKLMAPAAYHVEYRPHPKGEDLGWSEAAREAGLHLGWDGRTCSKHVMVPDQLDREDPRAGW